MQDLSSLTRIKLVAPAVEALSLNHVPPGNSPQVVLNISETWPAREVKLWAWVRTDVDVNTGSRTDCVTLDTHCTLSRPQFSHLENGQKKKTLSVLLREFRVDPRGTAWGTVPDVPCWGLSEPTFSPLLFRHAPLMFIPTRRPLDKHGPEAVYIPDTCPACLMDPAHGIFALSKRKSVNPQEV